MLWSLLGQVSMEKKKSSSHGPCLFPSRLGCPPGSVVRRASVGGRRARGSPDPGGLSGPGHPFSCLASRWGEGRGRGQELTAGYRGRPTFQRLENERPEVLGLLWSQTEPGSQAVDCPPNFVPQRKGSSCAMACCPLGQALPPALCPA